jgi:hypothetical protein
MPLLPRRLGAKLNPPTLFLELADSESGQIFHHRLLLSDKALLGVCRLPQTLTHRFELAWSVSHAHLRTHELALQDVRAIVDELSHAAPDFTESPALKAEVCR